MRSLATLRSIKVLHTVVWAVMAGAIVAIPVAAYVGWLRLAAMLSALVMVEVVVLAMNRMRCPLTGIAARYTTDRRANFDIYLPLWLATWNKQVFGALFVIGLLYTIVQWSNQAK
jgi:uncharacterized membrane protein